MEVPVTFSLPELTGISWRFGSGTSGPAGLLDPGSFLRFAGIFAIEVQNSESSRLFWN